MSDATYQSDAYRSQGSTAFVVTSSGVFDGSTATGRFLFAAGEISSADIAAGAIDSSHLASSAVKASKLDATLRKGIIPLNIFGARTLSSTGGELFSSANGGILTSASAPSISSPSTTDREIYVNFSSGAATALQFGPQPVPGDFTTQAAIKFKVLAYRGSTLDTGGNAPMLTAGLWFGSSDTELSSNTARITSTAVSSYSVSFSSGDLQGYPSVINSRLTSIVSTNDPVRVTAAWIEYTRLST